MQNDIKISIIIPIFNAEEFLHSCLESVINQTFREIEIICVNDGSTDNSLKILEEYQKKDNRIVIINNEKPTGAGFSRNRGIDSARGKYLYFIDADDFIDENLLEHTYNRAEKLNTDIVIFDVNVVTEHNYNKEYFCDKGYLSQPYPEVFDYKYIKDKVLSVLWNIWNKLYKTDFVRENKIRYMNSSLANDITFHLETILKAKRITYLNEKLYNYRYAVKNSITLRKSDEKYFSFFEVMLSIKNILKAVENDNFDKEYSGFIMHSLTPCFNNIADPKNKNKFRKKCRILLKDLPKSIVAQFDEQDMKKYNYVMDRLYDIKKALFVIYVIKKLKLI